MSEYMHHVAGRLRLRLTRIRKQPGRAREVEAAVARIFGVIAVEANSVTGSVLIRYDTAVVEVDDIVQAMNAMGLLSFNTAPASTLRQIQAPVLQASADKVLDVLVEKLIERSAIAIVGALL